MIWTLDASVALRWFIKNEEHAHSEKVLRALIDRPNQFAVPELFCFEVYSVMNRILKNGVDTYLRGMVPLLQSGILRYPMTALLASNAREYIRMGLTGYDACYAALAKDLQGKWLTFDEKAHRILSSLDISVLLSRDLPPDLA
jgi:predicted nucleic acid-binding protein